LVPALSRIPATADQIYFGTFMHSASAGPGVLLHAAESTPPCLEITIVAPVQVTETSRSPGLQLKSQLLLGAQVS